METAPGWNSDINIANKAKIINRCPQNFYRGSLKCGENRHRNNVFAQLYFYASLRHMQSAVSCQISCKQTCRPSQGVQNRFGEIYDPEITWKWGCVLLWPKVIFFSSALCASLTRLRREPPVSIRKKYPLEPRVPWYMSYETILNQFST